jgi:hypothetical protein
MLGLQRSGCHSRENGNPETKNRYPWIPASAGMTNPKDQPESQKFGKVPKIPEKYRFSSKNAFN